MQLRNWLGFYENFAARINWVRRARRFLNRKARVGAPGYVMPGQSSSYGPSRWLSSPRMRRALQKQTYYAAAIGNTERLEDRTLLAAFGAAVDTTNEDIEVELTFAELAAQGDEADVDGTVTAFVVQAVSTGTLKIGTSAGAATAFAMGSNDTIDATHNAYWTPASNANGSGLNAFTVKAKDNSGALSSSAVQVTVDVNAVNDAPVASGSATLAAVNEDTAAPAGDTVSNLFGGNFSDATDNVSGGSSADALYGVAITANAATGAQGTWQYFSGSWMNLPAVSTGAALVVKSADSLRFVPASDFNGTPGVLTATLIETGGATPATGTAVDISAGGATGGITIYSAASVTLSTSITAVNDAPSITLAGNQTVDQGTGAHSVSNFATGFSAGPANESSQMIADFIVSNDNNGLFSVQPDIANNGTLTFTLAAGVNGTATVTVQVQDDGGVANSGVDTSTAQTFDITVTPAQTTVTLSGSTLTITDADGGNSADDLTISYSGGTYTLTDAGGLKIDASTVSGSTGSGTGTITFPDTGISSIVVNTLAGNDKLTIGSALPDTLTFNGGTGSDELDISANASSAALSALDANGADGSFGSDAFTDVETFTGAAGGTLTGLDATSTWGLDGSPTYTSAGNSVAFSGFGTLQGGTGVDTFNVSANSAFVLKGGDGNDIFNFTGGTLTGGVLGEVGNDTYNLNGGSITGSITTGLQNDTVHVIQAATISAGISGAAGGGNDLFDIDAKLTTSGLTGGGGTDTLQGDAIDDVTITALSSTAQKVASGTEADITGGFSEIEVIIGNGGSLTGLNAGATWTIDAAPDYMSGGNSVGFSGFSTLNGGSGDDQLVVTANNAISLTFNGGTQTSSDSIVINGDDTDDAVVSSPTGASAGSLAIDFNTGGTDATITYTGLEPIDIVDVPDVTVNGTSGADTISIGNGTLIDGSTAAIAVTSAQFEDHAIRNATNLTINAGGNDDTVTLNASTGSSSLVDNVTVDTGAGSGDSVSVAGAFNFSGGTVEIVSSGTITDGGGSIMASNLALTAVSGAGASGNAIETAVSNLEASGGSGGIYVSNTGDVTIGSVSGALSGLSATNANISVTAAGSVTVSEAIDSNGGNVDLTATTNILVNADVSSDGGNITLNSDSDQAATPGGAIKIDGAVIASSGGSIVLGGGVDPTTAPAIGSATTLGRGVRIEGAGASINSSGGNISIRGKGLDGGSTSVSAGVAIDKPVSSGAGPITIVGTGGSTSGFGNYGVVLSNGTITSTSGNISVTGTAAGTGTSETGVYLALTSSISTATGAIDVTGTGAATGSGTGNYGILLANNANTIESTGSGSITLTATAGAASTDLQTNATSATIGGASDSGFITLNANSIAFSATTIVQSTGQLTIQPRTASTNINLGAGATDSGLQLDDTELGFLQDGFSSITIGSASGTGTVNVNASTFTDPVTIQSPMGAGAINVNGTLSGTDDASITLDGPGATTTLSANITTEGQNITISDSVIVAADVSIDTTQNGQTAGANVSVSGTINGDGTDDDDLTIDAGTGGTITIDGAIGATNELDNLTLNAAGASVALNGGEVSTINDQTYNVDVTISADTTINANDVTFNGTLDSIDATARALIVNADGVTSFNGTVGGTNDLKSITTDAAGRTDIGADINTNGSTITFNDDVLITANTTITEAGSGDVTFNGAVDSAAAAQYSLTVDTNGGKTIFNGAVNSDAQGALSHDSGLARIITADNLQFNASGSSAAITYNIDGTGAGTTYDQLDVTGSVDLGNATLNVDWGFTPSAGDEFILIDNDGSADAVTGTFNGLADGAIVTMNAGTTGTSGLVGRISYFAGDGNDVAIVIDETTAVAGPADDPDNMNAVSVVIVDDTVQVIDDGMVISAQPLGGVTNLQIDGVTGDDDAVTIDFDANPGLLTLNTITVNLNAGSGDTNDDISIVVGGEVLTLDLLNLTDGNLTIDGGPVIQFRGISQNTISLGGTPAALIINFSAPTDAIVFDDDAMAGFSHVTGTGFVSTMFANPSTSLTVNLDGDGNTVTFTDLDANFNPSSGVTINGGAGDDDITINDLGDTFGHSTTGALTVDAMGGTSDSLTFGTTAPSLASLSAAAETINVNVASVTTSGNQTYTGDIALGTDAELDGDNVGVTGGISGAHTLTLDGASSVDVSGTVSTTNLTTQTAATIGTVNIAGALVAGGGTLTTDVGGISAASATTTVALSSAAGVAVTGNTTSFGGNVTAVGTINLDDTDGVVITANVELDGADVDVESGISDGAGSFILTLDGSTSVDVAGAITTQNLTTQTAATVDSINIAGNLSTSGGLLTVDNGDAVIGGNATTGTAVTVSAGKFQVDGDSSLGGTVTASGDIDLNDSDGVVITANVELDGDNVDVSSGISDGAGSFTLTLDGATSVDVMGAITTQNLTTQTAATVDSINIAGNLIVGGGTLTTDTAGVVVGGTATTTAAISSATGVSVGGTSDLGGAVTASSGSIALGDTTADDVTLTANVVLTASGTVALAGGVDGNFDLTFAGSGGNDVVETIGSTINNLSVTAGALTAGTIDIDGNLNADTAVSTDTGAITVDGNVDTESTLMSALGVTVLGTSDLGGAVTASSGSIALGNATTDTITLTANVMVNSSANNGGIDFAGNVLGDFLLTVAAGTGTVDFLHTVGATTPLSGLTVSSAGTLNFDNTVAVDDEGIDITAGAVSFDNTVTTTNGGTVEVTNSGTLSTLAAADMTLDGAFTQNGSGAVNQAGDITTTADNITFTTAVTLGANVALSTGAMGGDVTFMSTINDDGATSNRTLSVTGGTGTVDFQAAIGSGQALAGLTIVSAGTADFESTVGVDALNLAVTAGIVNFDNTVTTTNGGTVTITNSGLLTIAAAGDFNLDGLFLQNGTGTVSTAGDIDTTNDNVTFTTAVTLTGNADIDTNTGAGTILFSSTIATGGNDLALDAGATGNVTLSGSITGGGDLTVRDGATQSYQVITVDSVDIQSSSTSVTFNDTVTVSANNATGTNALKTTAAGTITVDGAIVATATTDLNIDLDPTDVNVNAAMTATGDIDITASNNVTIDAVTVRADSDSMGGGTLTITADDDTSGAGDISAADGSTLRGHTVSLSGENITTDVVTADTGDATFTAANEVTLNDTTTATTAQVVVTATDDDVNINATVSAGTNVDIDATAGSVLQTAGNILAGGSVSLDAGTAIDLDGTIGATTAIGTSVSIATNINTPNVTIDGDVTANGAVTIGGANLTGSVTIGGAGSATDITADANASGAEDLTIRADGAVSQQTAGSDLIGHSGGVSITSDASTVSVISVDSDGANQLTSVAANNSGTAAIIIHANGTATVAGINSVGGNGTIEIVSDSASIALGDVNAGTGTAFLEAGLAVTDNNAASTNITATSAAITATTGIGSGAAGAELETTVATLAFSNATTSGDVQIVNSGALTIGTVGLQTSSSNTVGNVALQAASPITFAHDTTASGDILAQAIDDVAGTATNTDNITVNSAVTVESTGADVTFEAGDRIVTMGGSFVTAAGNIVFDSGFGDTDGDGSMSLDGTISAGTTVELDLNALGTATQPGTGTLTGTNLLLFSTGTNFPSFALSTSLTNNFTNLAASTTGDVFYRELNSINIDTVSNVSIAGTTSGISTGVGLVGPNTGGEVNISAINGTIDVNQPIDTRPPMMGGTGKITITGAVTVDAMIYAEGDDVTLAGSENASSDLIVNVGLQSGQTIDLSAPRDVIINAVVTTTGAGNINLNADQDSLGMGDGEGGVLITGRGGVSSANNVTITGSDGFNSTFLDETSAMTTGFANATSQEAVQIDVDNVMAGNNQVVAADDITIESGPNALGTSDLVVNGRVASSGTAGEITLTANDDALFGADGDVLSTSATSGTLHIFADQASAASTGGVLTMADGTLFNAGDADIELFADGTIQIGEVSSTALVNVASLAGSITDADGAAGNDITSGSLALWAATGIGNVNELGVGDAIETSMTSTNFAARTNSGDIHINNTGAITITDVALTSAIDTLLTAAATPLSGVTIADASGTLNSTNDHIRITTASPITVNSAILNNDGGDIVLSNSGTADDITISANLMITGSDATQDDDGNIEISSTQDVIINNDAQLTVDGSGQILVDATRAIAVSSNAATTTLQSVNGTISLTANAGSISGTFSGITINDSTITSANGAISLTGEGGDSGAGNAGIVIEAGGTVESTVSGAITLTGTGGDGSNDNHGVLITGAGSAVEAVLGSISITGTTGTVTGTQNSGVTILDSGTVTSTGTGATAATITIDGTGASGAFVSGGFFQGVRIDNSSVTSVDGAIAIDGQGSTQDQGVLLENSALVESTGTGTNAATVSISGMGGTNGVNSAGIGIAVSASSTIRSVDGDIEIDGTSTNNLGDRGVLVQSMSQILSTGTGTDAATITINGTGGDGADLPNLLSVGVYIADSGTLISSVDGDVMISGTGGAGTNNGNDGVRIFNGADITSTGTTSNAANITITGSGGGTATSSNDGVTIQDSGTQIISARGDIVITGTGGSSSGRGVELISGATITANTVSTLTITGDGTGGSAGVQIDSAVSSGTGFVTIQSPDDDIAFGVAGDVTSTSGVITVDAENAGTTASVIMSDNGADSTVIDAGSGTIEIDADVDVFLGRLVTTSASDTAVSITAVDGAVIDQGDFGGEDIDAANGRIVIDAETGVGNSTAGTNEADAELEIDAGSVDIYNNASGVVDLEETNSISIFRILQHEDDAIEVTATGTITVASAGSGVIIDDTSGQNSAAADIHLLSTGGSINVNQIVRNDSDDATADIDIDANGQFSDVALTAAVTAAEGNITITADDAVTMSAAGDVTITDSPENGGANIIVRANTATTDGDSGDGVTMANGAVIDAGAGTITVTALDATNAGNITLGRLVTNNGTSAAVLVQTDGGEVIDGGDSGGEDIDASAAGALITITAATGIGDAAQAGGAGDRAIEIDAATGAGNGLDASVTGTGGIDIDETDGINLLNVDTDDGFIRVDAGGAIVAGDVQSITDDDANDIMLNAGGDITVGIVRIGTLATATDG
ncbi:hypothetical protein GC176_27800, partial [bacterium]|nr:hypothetical protein [bacterium]